MSEASHPGVAFPFSAKESSPTMPAFDPKALLVEPFPRLDDLAFPLPPTSSDSPSKHSSDGSDSTDDSATEPEPERPSSRRESGLYDLKPPPPAVSHSNMELLARRLFSVDHLRVILEDELLSGRFTAFLNAYKPHCAAALVRYHEIQKALAAIEYGNAVATHLCADTRGSAPLPAASLNEKFSMQADKTVKELVDGALAGYINHRLVSFVTECLVKEITGNSTPLMKDMVHGLAEVYCITDTSLPDNPIVYASEGMTTQYGRDYVIGRNCRFLQGPETSQASVGRLKKALKTGKEACELLLNYRRDGSPFLNLLMMAPLYDNKGAVRYFLGCQIDVNNLIVGGRGLDSFQRLLAQDRSSDRIGESTKKEPMRALADLCQLFTHEEVDLVKRRAVTNGYSGASTPARSGTSRRFLGMEDSSDRGLWPSPNYGPSGRLPGVYQNYLLVRPYPSFRIIFTSAALRIPGLVQSRLIDRIGGPAHVRDGLIDALAHGSGVTAKVTWLPAGAAGSEDNHSHGAVSTEGKPRWLHCTPMLGSDDRVGVWMIVMVEHEPVTGSLNAVPRPSVNGAAALSPTAGSRDGHSYPRVGDMSGAAMGVGNAKFSEGRLYAEYLRREGRADGSVASEKAHRGVEGERNGRKGLGRFVEEGLQDL